MGNKNGWIGVDLDGTLAHYDSWRGIEHIGAPIVPMVARVKRWLAEGHEVRIFTARVDGGEVAIGMGDQNGVAHRDVARVRMFIEAWCLQHIGQILPITNVKDYGMHELWDDRAVQVHPNTGFALGQSRRGLDDPQPAVDRWFDMREYMPGFCYDCDGSGSIEAAASSTSYIEVPCPTCCPLSHRLRQPIVPDDVKTDPGPDMSPQGQARYLRDNPESIESHASLRKLVSTLVGEKGGAA